MRHAHLVRRIEMNLKAAIELEKISQEELAKQVGVSQSTISRAIAGARKLSPATQARIAKTLGMPESAIFPREPKA
jgi:transcriptional regulator with XRE-family HTH domain